MSYKYLTDNNISQKINFEEYLYSIDEPIDDILDGMSAKLEVKLLKNSLRVSEMRQNFRRLAMKLRARAA